MDLSFRLFTNLLFVNANVFLLSHMLTVGDVPSDKDVTLNPSVGL